MVSEDVTINVRVNTTQAKVGIAEVQAQADAVVKQWKIDRAILIQQVREGFTLISQLWSTFRQAMSLFDQQIDPFFSALIGMVLSTTSMLISSAAVLSATVLGAPVGAILFGVAISFNILTLTKLVTDKIETESIISGIRQTVGQAGNFSSAQQPRAGLGGF